MNYKLKDHVTDEMLKAIGYRVIKSLYYEKSMCAANDEFDIYINLNEHMFPKNTIIRNTGSYITKKRIKHLTDLNYVEVVK